MSLEVKVMEQMKEAMKAKNTIALEALRAIKSGIILAKTESGSIFSSNNGCVVQLDRISDFGSEGWGFEPLRGH
jgi:uncharacterized protein YqeY